MGSPQKIVQQPASSRKWHLLVPISIASLGNLDTKTKSTRRTNIQKKRTLQSLNPYKKSSKMQVVMKLYENIATGDHRKTVIQIKRYYSRKKITF